jgi:PPK2 family polyphosphate:nucleotide phosphotransferase
MLIQPGSTVRLKDIDPDDTGPHQSQQETKDLLKDQLVELEELQYRFYAQNQYGMLIILQGMDTSGKDGTIRHVMTAFSPLGVHVHSFKKPTEFELAHDYLWRIHQKVPPKGAIHIFNRSQYEDVLVVRVHELVPKKVWQQRYEQINAFEKMLSENNVIILKFFLHISKKEQKERLEERLRDSTRNWKFSLADLKERGYWNDYQKAYEDVLNKCSTPWAPWRVIPADKKWYRNLLVAQTLVAAFNDLKMEQPKPSFDVSKVKID